jgi:hypothetical protein
MIKCSQEEPELEETIKHQVEDVLACVDQRTQNLCKELSEKIDAMQLDLSRPSIRGPGISRTI